VGFSQVGDLGVLLHEVEHDLEAKQHLKSSLKLDDPVRWNKLREAVNAAVPVDNRVRMFCSTSHTDTDGDDLYVLFYAHEGKIGFEQKDPRDHRLPDPPSVLGMLHRQAGGSNSMTYVLHACTIAHKSDAYTHMVLSNQAQAFSVSCSAQMQSICPCAFQSSASTLLSSAGLPGYRISPTCTRTSCTASFPRLGGSG
jgi:hypothetical protein